MNLREFHNGLRILLNIDRHELVDGGVIQDGDDNAWSEFQRDPFRWMIRASDQVAGRLWKLMESRMS